MQAMGYSLILTGREEEGVNVLRRKLAMCADDDRDWAVAEQKCDEDLVRLAESDPSAAVARLRGWAEEMVVTLKLQGIP